VAFFTSRGASVHLYLSSLPIDLWVVVLEPGIAKDHALLSKAGDSKECPFRVGLVTEDYIYYFRDLPCFVGGAIYVVHWYGARDTPGANLSMKMPVAPESRSALTECTSLVSVVLILIGRVIDVLWASRVLAESCLGSLFSYFGL